MEFDSMLDNYLSPKMGEFIKEVKNRVKVSVKGDKVVDVLISNTTLKGGKLSLSIGVVFDNIPEHSENANYKKLSKRVNKELKALEGTTVMGENGKLHKVNFIQAEVVPLVDAGEEYEEVS